ncbi:hypothetical protein AJ78_06893 [Emergomyces pasteurianus Ep9510]|uniref:Uncharacterized protein n=1 Tax=Emergomyces pasteurianus Ep9510 TaxID=1447872 RepID=A0A1J9P7V5_9EURO|nr:hypothetical protein AJ78_06893 [Emergomyces pasteurianus Ep9510]
MGVFTYDIAFSGPVDGSLSTQLNTAHLLKANTPDPRSNEKPLHLLSMLMPMLMLMPLFSVFVHLFKNAAIDVSLPSLQLLDFFDDLIEKAHSSPRDVANDPLSR